MFSVLKVGLERKLYGFCDNGNIVFMKLGERLFFTLYISIASFCKFLWCVENELSILIIAEMIIYLPCRLGVKLFPVIYLFYCLEFCGTSTPKNNMRIEIR